MVCLRRARVSNILLRRYLHARHGTSAWGCERLGLPQNYYAHAAQLAWHGHAHP